MRTVDELDRDAVLHLDILERDELAPEVDVNNLNGRNSTLDLMLHRRRPVREDHYEHLVVELKRPSVTLGQEEIGQIERYAFAVAANERFDKNNTE